LFLPLPLLPNNLIFQPILALICLRILPPIPKQ
jgi:hypothetical protein